jgi:uncharacterized phage protein gp47/JayE
MAFARPTLSEITDRVQEDLRSRLQLVAPILRRALVYVLARVIAGAVHLLYGFLEFLSRQIFPDLSEEEYLLRQVSLYGLSRNAAAFAAGNVVIHGTNLTVIPIDTVLLGAEGAEFTADDEVTIATLTAWASGTAYAAGALRSNGGKIYLCTVAGTSAGSGGPTGTGTAIVDNTATWRYIADGTAAVLAAVTASLAGADSNRDLGVALSFESPIAGANATATVSTGGLSGGADQETIAALRVRLIERLRSPPHGGNAADYVAWAKEVAGVTRAWCYPLEGGAGTVTVRFVRDDDASLIPDAGEVTAVANHIATVRPVTAVVTVAAPTADVLNFTIAPTPSTTATKAAITAELTDLLLRVSEPGGTILLSQILTVVGTAEGVTDFEVTVPAADVTHATGHMATMGTITWA